MEAEAAAMLILGMIVILPIGIGLNYLTFGDDGFTKSQGARTNRNRRQSRRKAVKRAEEQGYTTYWETTSNGQMRKQATDKYRD